MKLESKEKPVLFSYTEIPDIFFTEYMQMASGDCVKVYFYMVFLANYNKEININEIAKSLALQYSTVEKAIQFWEEQGLIIKIPTGYSLANIQEIELAKLYNPKISSSPEDMKKTEKSKERAHTVECINNQFFHGVMSPSWYPDIDMLFEKYGFDDQVMFTLFNYANDNGGLHLKYITTVADGWYKCNIRTLDDLENYFEKREKINGLKREISKTLRLNRPLNAFEEEKIEKWNQEFGYGMDIINLALGRSTNTANAGFAYFDKILTDWHNKEYKTISDIQNHLNASQKNKVKKSDSIPNNYEFTQSTFDSLNLLYDN